MATSRRSFLRTSSALRATLCGSAAVLALSFCREAHASGFATARFGGEHGHPTTDNPTALYYNPAGIAEDTPGTPKKFWHVKIFADANIAFRWASFSHAQSDHDEPEPEGAKGANTGNADLFNVVTAPAAAATVQLENFAFGVGFFVPLGGASAWGKNDQFADNKSYAGPVDGVQRWHAIDGTIRSLYFTLGAAYDILDRVSLGASLNIIKSEVNTVRAREPSGTNSVDAEGRSLIDVSGWNAGLGVGVIGEVSPEKVWIGFSYQSQPGFGEMRLKGTLKNNYGGSVTTDEVSLLQELPDVYRLGVRARPIPTVELRVFGDVTNWSVLRSQCVVPGDTETCDVNDDGSPIETSNNVPYLNLVRNWGPAFGIRAGGSYWVIPALELYLGAGYDGNAVPDSTLEPALTDFHKASLAGGLRLTVGPFSGDLSYTHLFYVPRDTTGQSELSTYSPPSKSPDSGGRYTQTIGFINANVQLAF